MQKVKMAGIRKDNGFSKMSLNGQFRQKVSNQSLTYRSQADGILATAQRTVQIWAALQTDKLQIDNLWQNLDWLSSYVGRGP